MASRSVDERPMNGLSCIVEWGKNLVPIGQTLVGILSTAAIVGSLWGLRLALRRGRGNASTNESRWDFEVRPLGFVIELGPQRPSIAISLQAVNHLSRPVTLVEVKISPLSMYGVPDISNVPLAEDGILVPARSTQMVVCRRNLMDGETRALRQLTGKHTASCSLVAKARHKRRDYRYGPVAGMQIEGKINRHGPAF
jgi:hypothetical protein